MSGASAGLASAARTPEQRRAGGPPPSPLRAGVLGPRDPDEVGTPPVVLAAALGLILIAALALRLVRSATACRGSTTPTRSSTSCPGR